MAKVDLGQVVGADGKDALIDETVTGKIASFSDGCVGMPMKSIVAEITPVQSGSGDPSPENIRPISGRTGLTVTVQSGDTQNTYPISWQTEAGTIYGGTLDVVSGRLTVDSVGIILDGTTHRFIDRNTYWHITPTDYGEIKTYRHNTQPEYVLSSFTMGVSKWGTTGNNNDILFTRASNWTNIFNSVDDINNFITVTPQQLVVPLATPQTYQLTPTEVRTLLGVNNLWSDAGDVSVEYTADTKMYIDKRLNTTRMMIAGVETSFVATKNYAIGDFVIVNDTLYRITAVITSGETITPGTNASETTVAEQLIALE